MLYKIFTENLWFYYNYLNKHGIIFIGPIKQLVYVMKGDA